MPIEPYIHTLLQVGYNFNSLLVVDQGEQAISILPNSGSWGSREVYFIPLVAEHFISLAWSILVNKKKAWLKENLANQLCAWKTQPNF